MDLRFIGSVAVISRDASTSRQLYVDALGLPLEGEPDGYLHSEHIEGSKSFGIWPLTQAAQVCFGTTDWPEDHPVPQASIEFEVADADAVAAGAAELTRKGYALLHAAQLQPWGQTVARLQSPEGLIVGISFAPELQPS
jgi:catechol 2,3-dioxygenase-like lactoylglutathione lyase family enzyme